MLGLFFKQRVSLFLFICLLPSLGLSQPKLPLHLEPLADARYGEPQTELAQAYLALQFEVSELASAQYENWQNNQGISGFTYNYDESLEKSFQHKQTQLIDLGNELIANATPLQVGYALTYFPHLATGLGLAPSLAGQQQSLDLPRFSRNAVTKHHRRSLLIRWMELGEESNPELAAELFETLLRAQRHAQNYYEILSQMALIEAEREIIGQANADRIRSLETVVNAYAKEAFDLNKVLRLEYRNVQNPRYREWIEGAVAFLDESPALPTNVGEMIALPLWGGAKVGWRTLTSRFHRHIRQDEERALAEELLLAEEKAKTTNATHVAGLKLDRAMPGFSITHQSNPFLALEGVPEGFAGLLSWVESLGGEFARLNVAEGSKILFIDGAQGIMSIAAARENFVEDYAKTAGKWLQGNFTRDEALREERLQQASVLAVVNAEKGYLNPEFSPMYTAGVLVGARGAIKVIVAPISVMRGLASKVRIPSLRWNLSKDARAKLGVEWKPKNTETRNVIDGLIAEIQSTRTPLDRMMSEARGAIGSGGRTYGEGTGGSGGSGGGGTVVRPSSGNSGSPSGGTAIATATRFSTQTSQTSAPGMQVQSSSTAVTGSQPQASGAIITMVPDLEIQDDMEVRHPDPGKLIEERTKAVREQQERLFLATPGAYEDFKGDVNAWIAAGSPTPHDWSKFVEFNSREYYAMYFTGSEELDAAEAAARKEALQMLEALFARTTSNQSEARRLAEIVMEIGILNITDFDGTRSRLGDLGEERNAQVDEMANVLADAEKAFGITSIKASGRPLAWPGIGLLNDIENLPALAIGEAGTALAIDGFPSKDYAEFLKERMGFNREELDGEVVAFLEASQTAGQILALRAQIQNAVTTKLAYDVQFPENVVAEAIADFQKELEHLVSQRAKVVMSHFIETENEGIKNSYRIDIVPGNKADAADYVALKAAEAEITLPIITAGDSGNDIALVGAARNVKGVEPQAIIQNIFNGSPLGSNVFIAVANRHASLREEIDQLAVPAEEYLIAPDPNGMLNGVYFIMNAEGLVEKVILDDSELNQLYENVPLGNRHGPESILNAYQLIFGRDAAALDAGSEEASGEIDYSSYKFPTFYTPWAYFNWWGRRGKSKLKFLTHSANKTDASGHPLRVTLSGRPIRVTLKDGTTVEGTFKDAGIRVAYAMSPGDDSAPWWYQFEVFEHKPDGSLGEVRVFKQGEFSDIEFGPRLIPENAINYSSVVFPEKKQLLEILHRRASGVGHFWIAMAKAFFLEEQGEGLNLKGRPVRLTSLNGGYMIEGTFDSLLMEKPDKGRKPRQIIRIYDRNPDGSQGNIRDYYVDRFNNLELGPAPSGS